MTFSFLIFTNRKFKLDFKESVIYHIFSDLITYFLIICFNEENITDPCMYLKQLAQNTGFIFQNLGNFKRLSTTKTDV